MSTDWFGQRVSVFAECFNNIKLVQKELYFSRVVDFVRDFEFFAKCFRMYFFFERSFIKATLPFLRGLY